MAKSRLWRRRAWTVERKQSLAYSPVKYESVHSTRWRERFSRRIEKDRRNTKEGRSHEQGKTMQPTLQIFLPHLHPSHFLLCPEEISQRKKKEKPTILSRRPSSRLNLPPPLPLLRNGKPVVSHLHAASFLRPYLRAGPAASIFQRRRMKNIKRTVLFVVDEGRVRVPGLNSSLVRNALCRNVRCFKG